MRDGHWVGGVGDWEGWGVDKIKIHCLHVRTWKNTFFELHRTLRHLLPHIHTHIYTPKVKAILRKQCKAGDSTLSHLKIHHTDREAKETWSNGAEPGSQKRVHRFAAHRLWTEATRTHTGERGPSSPNGAGKPGDSSTEEENCSLLVHCV